MNTTNDNNVPNEPVVVSDSTKQLENGKNEVQSSKAAQAKKRGEYKYIIVMVLFGLLCMGIFFYFLDQRDIHQIELQSNASRIAIAKYDRYIKLLSTPHHRMIFQKKLMDYVSLAAIEKNFSLHAEPKESTILLFSIKIVDETLPHFVFSISNGPFKCAEYSFNIKQYDHLILINGVQNLEEVMASLFGPLLSNDIFNKNNQCLKETLNYTFTANESTESDAGDLEEGKNEL